MTNHPTPLTQLPAWQALSAHRTMARNLSLLLVVAAAIAALATLSGCSSRNGFFGQPQQTYTLTVTATTGTLSHSTDVTLTVQ